MTRYDEDLASLKEVSSNLAHFYAATTHILHSQPHIAKQMNCVMSYEIKAPVRQVADKSAINNVIKAAVGEHRYAESVVEIANRFGPDAHAELPIVHMKSDHSPAIDQIEDYMIREFELMENKTPNVSRRPSVPTSPRATTETHKITIDMRNCEGAMKVYLGDVPI